MQGINRGSIFTRFLVVAAIICTGLLSGCGVDNEQRLARGEEAFTAGEYRAAAIDARTVLQKDPDNIEGRLLLGRAALHLGDYGSADKELRRALDLGASPGDVADALGRVLLAMRNFDDILTLFPADLEGVDELLLLGLRADANLGLGNAEEARELYQQILIRDESNREAMLGIVSTYLAESRFEQARATLTQVLTIDNEYVPAWIKSASMHMMSRNPAAAAADFSRAAELAKAQGRRADEATALRGLTETLLQQNKLDEARAALDRLLAIAPEELGSVFLQGRLAFAEGDLQSAQGLLQDLLRIAPEYRPGQTLLGAVNLGLGNLGQADMYLSAVVAAEPGNADARRLLAETRIQQNQADDAALLLQPLMEGGNADAQVLALAARARLASGNYSAATEILEARAKADPDNIALKLDLAAAYLSGGDSDAAAALLADASSDSEADEYRRRMLEVLTSVRRNAFEQAVTDVRAMIEDYPEDPRLQNVLGGIHMATRNYDAAEAAFDAALALAPDDKRTLMNLGQLETSRGNVDRAREHFSAALEADPDDSGAMVALAMVASTAGDQATMVEWLQRARNASSDSTVARLLLARHLIGQKAYAEAAEVATEAAEIDPLSPDAHALLGMALDGQGDAAAALENYRKAASIESDNPRYAMNYARALIQAGDKEQASRELDSIQDGATDIATLGQLAVLRAGTGDYEGALEIVADMKTRFPESDAPHVLHGEFLFRTGDPVQAARQFDLALSKRLSFRVAARAAALRNEYGLPDPQQPVERYLDANPGDEAANLILAQFSQSSGRDVDALQRYEAIVQANPDNVTALNNLAWLKFTKGEDGAEALARQAFALDPDNSSIVDTLGWILVNSGKLEEGLQLLRQADEDSGGRPAIRYHLAAALVKVGDDDEARRLLEEVLAGDRDFADRDKAEALLRGL